MSIRPTLLKRLVARIVRKRRFALRCVGACLLATTLSATADAQLIDGLVYSASDSFGTTFSDQDIAQTRQTDQTQMYVGPGGPTSPMNVPSVLNTPTASRQAKTVQWPANTQLPGTMQLPLASPQVGGDIPCPCDPGCTFTYYGNVEALYFRRDYDERFTLSQAALPPFDYEWAGRITVGQVADCVNGYEFVYAGPLRWNRSRLVTGAGDIQSRINNTGFIPAVIAPFNDADSHFQTYQARMNTYEFNRRWWAWDVFSTLIGVKVVDYREAYGLFSNGPAGLGIYEDFTRNTMVGPQVGGDLMQPLGMRTLVGVKGKAALLANFSRNELFLNTAPMGKVDNSVDVAGFFELGTYLNYSITPSIRLTGGYEMWYIPGVATVASQGLNVLNVNTADKVDADDDLFIHGATMGVQILF